MSQLPLVTTIVVNYNGRIHLERCLPALLAQRYPSNQITIVDNGSQDDSLAYARARCPHARIIALEQNRGFAAATNLGILQSDGVYVALLNNDAYPEPDWLEQLVAVAERDARIGMVASKMLFVQPCGMINSAGICVDRAGIAWDRFGGAPDEPGKLEPEEVFGACAGASLYRRTMFDEIGLFDEDFFAYLEDVDLAWRAQLAGWRALYAPQARVVHWHSATSQEGSPFKSWLLGRNKLWLIAKNYPTPYLWTYLPFIFAYDLAALTYAIVIRRDLNALRGRIAGIRGLPAVLRKRHSVQALRRAGAANAMERIEPLANPFSVSHRYAHIRARQRG